MTDTLHLRPFQPSDAPRCCEIVMECIPIMAGLNPAARTFLYSKNTPARLMEELNSLLAFVCFKDQAIIGLGALDVAKAEIKRVYVDPSQQQHGAGLALMRALEAKGTAQHLKSVLVQSSPNAHTFYERLGYQLIDEGRLVIGEAVFQFLNMQKVLG